MDNKTKQEYLEFAKKLAGEAGKIMKEYFRSEKTTTSWKDGDSPVTIADSIINKLVIQRVKSQYPEHGILGEEEGFEADRTTVWIVDPIDGTNPYNLGMPTSTFCLALVADGEVQVAVVLDPFLDRLFCAVRGGGSCVNNEPLKIMSGSKFKHSYMFAQADRTDNSDTTSKLHKTLKQMGVKIISIPSFTYMALMITEGKMIAAFMPYGSPWDAAAISLIIQEAGGVSTDLKGNIRKYNEWGDGILLTNGVVHNQLVELIKKCES